MKKMKTKLLKLTTYLYMFCLYRFIRYHDNFFLKMKTGIVDITIMEIDAECLLFGNF